MRNHLNRVSSVPVFNGVSAAQLDALLDLLGAQLRHFSKEETIYNQGSLQRMSGVVLQGTAELHFCDENFNLVNLIHLNEGALFGAAMLLAGHATSPMELCAVTDCDVLFLNFDALTQAEETIPEELRSSVHRVTVNLLQEFARRLEFLNRRVRILSQRKLRDKIKVYLQGLPRAGDGTILLPMNRNQMAEFLYVDRSALSRELGNLQREGVLQVKGRSVTLLKPEFLFE